MFFFRQFDMHMCGCVGIIGYVKVPKQIVSRSAHMKRCLSVCSEDIFQCAVYTCVCTAMTVCVCVFASRNMHAHMHR
jgi:hypothetical protein